ncbi:helix-turn-helix domain-containing protein [Streptomyces sp. SB3404]|uniref:Helix-turn-helix domain-containing protein n=1 Tax=Streptomyces boncukensis TaxID=2711219 RepID=A0A6G4X7E9_9ACTN|nr:helix-turn-helix domain-containing protein [Streptomyces boncukensis]
MSIKVTNWVWARSESRNGPRLVMLALADRADDDGFAWPSIEDLCERTKLSPRAVQKAISNLVELGELKVESGGGRRVRNRYTIIPKPCTSDGVTSEYPGPSDGVTDGKPRTSDGVSPEETPHFEAETPHFATETPSIVRENPVKSAGEPPLEPPEEPSGNHHNNPAAKKDRLTAARDAEEEDRLPEEIVRLQDAMSGAGINLPWKFHGDDMVRVINDIRRLGIPLMVEQAVKAEQSAAKAPFSSRWFYDSWHAIRTPVALDHPGGNVIRLPHGQPLPGTDTKVAGWMALSDQLRQNGGPT